MDYIADLHIHSPFSRATSKQSTLAGLFAWARIKGINLVATGDFTHPAWQAQLREHLVAAEPGFWRLKNENVPSVLPVQPDPIAVRFVLTAEISSIYKKDGRVRKIHNLLLAPDFESVARVTRALAAIGNIESDGRPILGLDARDLLEIMLEHCPDGFLVPAHIWTPWFSLFGSKSGFDRVEDCFADLSEHIFAMETGLSSDPAMNRRVSQLDRYTLISNSDCHSPAKLGREANCFSTDFSFYAMRDALRFPGRGGFTGTVEFYPQEGKYHFDGHRKCGVVQDPDLQPASDGLCPVCNRPLTVGVQHRVLDLADRREPRYPGGAKNFRSLIPLPEILAELFGCGPNTKKVLGQYGQCINRFGSEYTIVLATPLEDLRRHSTLLAEAISRLRADRVLCRPGYDGVFGAITLFAPNELDIISGQRTLFAIPAVTPPPAAPHAADHKPAPRPQTRPGQPPGASADEAPNPEQQAAIESSDRAQLVIAGPGTGKTHTLVARLCRLLDHTPSAAADTVVITFTNRAALELTDRLRSRLGPPAQEMFIGTFHRFCLEWLRREQPDLAVAGPEERRLLLRRLRPEAGSTQLHAYQREIERFFTRTDADPGPVVEQYCSELARQRLIDLDQVIPAMVRRLRQDKTFRAKVEARTRHLYIDEFQDINAAQYDLVRAVGAQTLFAIGDPDQAIYGFRGSQVRLFFDFAAATFAAAPVVCRSLRYSYRSGATIISAANALIAHNLRPNRVPLVAWQSGRGRLEQYWAANPDAEAEQVVARIEEVLGGISHFSMASGRSDGEQRGYGFQDIAVLYRLSRQAEPLRCALERRGIPFQLVGHRPFFRQPVLEPVYLSLLYALELAGPAEQLALLRHTHGLGDKARRRLEALPLRDSADMLDQAATLLPTAGRKRVAALKEQLLALRTLLGQQGVRAAIRALCAHLDISPASAEATRLLQLAGAMADDPAAFGHHLQQNAQTTVYDPRAQAVSLLTMHSAKGLEFPVVFIVGCEEGITPHITNNPMADIDEERRLFYVALTRARDLAILSLARQRRRHGRKIASTPSRFLKELPPELVQKQQPNAAKRRKKIQQLSLFLNR